MRTESKSMVRSVARLLVALLVLLATTHCSTTNRPSGAESPDGWKEIILSSEIEDESLTGAQELSVEREGDLLTVIARQKCESTRVVSIRRTGFTSDQKFKRVMSGLVIGAGIAAVAGSVALSVHAHNLGETVDWDDREDAAAQQAVVWSTLGAVALGTVGLLGVIHGPILLLDTSPKTEEIERRTKLPEAQSCQSSRDITQRSALIELEPEHRASPRAIKLGRTDKEGKFTVDLKSAVPASWAKADKPSRVATLIVGGKKAGLVKIAALLEAARARIAKKRKRLADKRAQDDDAAWSKSKVGNCRKPMSSTDCSAVRRYLRRFPQGRHADQARGVLKRVKGKLARLERNEAAREAVAERAEQRREEARQRRETAASKRECLGECRSSFRRCNQSCSGLSTIASCRRQCRLDFTSCESDCARESRGD